MPSELTMWAVGLLVLALLAGGFMVVWLWVVLPTDAEDETGGDDDGQV